MTPLERLGLHRAELRAWAMYDWANSAFVLVVVTTVFPIFYYEVPAATLDQTLAASLFAGTTTAALAVGAVLSPFLGALADHLGWRKHMMAGFVILGVAATCAMHFLGEGAWLPALLLFALGNLGFSLSLVFYDSFLPHLTGPEEMDRVSAAGYGLGYLGSGLLLLFDLWTIRDPTTFRIADAHAAMRLAFVTAGLWWGLFSVPLFHQVREPQREVASGERLPPDSARAPCARLAHTLRELRGSYRQAFLMLLAFLLYNDGIGTIVRLAAIYATIRGLPRATIITAIVMVQFIGVPCSWILGNIGARFGAKRTIGIGLIVYIAACVLAYRMQTTLEFYTLAFLIGLVQGGTQALSRSLFASLIPKHKASEFFGFFSFFEKLGGIIGPTLFASLITLRGSPQVAVLSVIVLFLAGGLVLTRVDARVEMITGEPVVGERKQGRRARQE